mgnify:CR=1 FL=1
MASKVDEDSEEGRKSVEERLDGNREKYEQCAVEEVRKEEHLKNRSKFSANAQVVEELFDNVSGEDSESETFQDAVEDLNEKINSCKAKSSEDTNEEEKERKNEVAEEEERLTPEEKEVRILEFFEFQFIRPYMFQKIFFTFYILLYSFIHACKHSLTHV